MSTLTTLKSAASGKLAAAESDVKNYVLELEATVNAHKPLLIGVGVGCLLIGVVIGHLIG